MTSLSRLPTEDLPAQSLRRSLLDMVGHLSVVMVFNLVSYGLRFALTILIAREWGPSFYGQVALVMSMGSLMFIPLALGQHSVMYKYLPTAEDDHKNALMWTVLTINIVICSTLSVILLLLQPLVTGQLQIEPVFWVLAIMLAIGNNFQALSESLLRGQQKFSTIGWAKLISTLILLAMVLSLLFRDLSNLPLFIGAFFFSTIVFSILALLQSGLKRVTLNKAFFHTAIRYGAVVMVNQVIIALMFDGDLILLSSSLTTAQLGIYAAHLGILKQLFFIFFVEIFCVVFLPTLAKLDRKELLRWLLRMGLVGVICVYGLSFMALMVILFLFGDDFSFQLPLVAIGAAGITAFTVFQMLNHILTMEGRTGARRAFIAVLCCLPVFFLGLPYAANNYGIIGALSSATMIYTLLIGTTLIALNRQFTNNVVSD